LTRAWSSGSGLCRAIGQSCSDSALRSYVRDTYDIVGPRVLRCGRPSKSLEEGLMLDRPSRRLDLHHIDVHDPLVCVPHSFPGCAVERATCNALGSSLACMEAGGIRVEGGASFEEGIGSDCGIDRPLVPVDMNLMGSEFAAIRFEGRTRALKCRATSLTMSSHL